MFKGTSHIRREVATDQRLLKALYEGGCKQVKKLA
jgi:hypothetical protein